MPLLSSTSMSASFCCVSWNPPIGLPNCSRVFEYSSADEEARRAAPMAPHTMPKRASVRHRQRALQPAHAGEHGDAGSRTSSRTSSEVTDARSDSLRGCPSRRSPASSVGRRSRGCRRRSAPTRSATSAMPPFVIHIFEPFRTQSSPLVLRARPHRRRVAAAVGLGQAEAADRPRPAAMRGSHSCFCSSRAVLPDREHRERALHARRTLRNPESPASSSMQASPYATALVPAQP